MADRILVSCPNMLATMDELRPQFAELGLEVDTPDFEQQLREHELLEIIDRYDGWIAGDDEATAKVMQAATRLRMLSKWGVGTDNVDKDAAAALGIRVTNTPGAFGDEVADVAMGYLILLHRQLHVIDREVRAGRWAKPMGRSLRDRRLVVVGLGSIGTEVVRRAAVAGMVVHGIDPFEASRDAATRAGAAQVGTDLAAAMGTADAVCLCAPLTPETRHILDASTLGAAPRGLLVVNVSRGPLVEQAALIGALESGQVGAAALDVFEVEPLPTTSPLASMDNVVLGSHNGSNTIDAVRRVNQMAIDNLVTGLREVTR